MLRIITITLALLVMAGGAEARGHRHHAWHGHHIAPRSYAVHPDCNILFPCVGVAPSSRGEVIARKAGIGGAVMRYSPQSSLKTPKVHRRHIARNIVARPVEISPSWPATGTTTARPADCYGIAWCGCFLRHYLGMADRGLNLAANWARVGSPTVAHSGVVVVWRHHVGLIRSEPDARGVAMVLSGNDGHAVRERPRSLRGAIAFREI
jgi:hypothetical protein